MKKNLIILMTAMTTIVISCKKNKSETPEQPQGTVNGYYEGKRNFDPSSNEWTHNYAILFRQNGTVRVYNLTNGTDTSALLNLAKMDGTWLQSGSNLQVSYKPVGSLITITSTLNKGASEINGTWGFEGETKGKFFLIKK